PGLMRGESMSSIRAMSLPLRERMESQASRYVRTLPICCAPVGDGASRPASATRGSGVFDVMDYSVEHNADVKDSRPSRHRLAATDAYLSMAICSRAALWI